MRSFRALTLALGLSSGMAMAATPVPMTCPTAVHQSGVPENVAGLANQTYSMEVYRGTTLVTSTVMTVLEGQWAPMSVSREQGYLASYTQSPKDAQGKTTTVMTPGVATEGMNFLLRTDTANSVEQTLSYSLTLSRIEDIGNAGPKEAPIQVAHTKTDGPFCGQIVLRDGVSQTFPLGDSGLVVRVVRHAVTPAVASIP